MQDLLGAIVYTAAMVILKEEERQKWNETNQCAEPWQPAISEQEAQARAQVALKEEGRQKLNEGQL